MAQQQSKLEFDDDDAPAGFQIVCCPVQLNRSSSEAPPTQTLPSSLKIAPSTAAAVEVEDTPAPAQLSGSRTTSLQRPSSFQRSISLHREPSHPTTPNDEEQPNINVQRSTSQESRGDIIAIQPSRSRSFANSQHGSVNQEQPDINVQRSTSQSQTGHVDDIAIHPFQSQSHHSNSQHDSINEEDFAVVTTSIPYGQEEEQEQEGLQVIEPRQRRQRRPRNKCATAAILCVCLGVCAGLVVLFLSTDTLIQQSLQRHGSPRDYDGDGLSDELELLSGYRPFECRRKWERNNGWRRIGCDCEGGEVEGDKVEGDKVEGDKVEGDQEICKDGSEDPDNSYPSIYSPPCNLSSLVSSEFVKSC